MCVWKSCACAGDARLGGSFYFQVSARVRVAVARVRVRVRVAARKWGFLVTQKCPFFRISIVKFA